jgi:macrolide transport system ATP-binding/permease protein
LLQLCDVCRYYRNGSIEVRALHNVSLDVLQGEFLAVMGQSGSGKSTLMNIMGCLDQPTAGRYRVDGHDVGGLNADELSALRLKTFGFVFQRDQLLANYTALENVAMPAIYSGMGQAQRRQRAGLLLEQLGLAGRAGHRPSELSGGEQQRVCIARALINGARVILADEPTGALDSANGRQVLDLLKTLNAEQGVTVILITHDPEVARHADRIIQIRDGEIREDSRPARRAPVEAGNPAAPAVFPDIGILESVALSLRSLRANLFRTLLTLLGIIIGVASVVTMMAIGEGGKQQVLQRIEAMGTNLLQVWPGGRNIRASGDIATLSMADADAIAALPGVEAVAPERDDRTTLRHGGQDYAGRVRGVTPVYFSIRDWQLSRGVFLNDEDLKTYASVMVLGQTVAEQLFPDNENPIGAFVLMKNTLYQVIGVLKAKGATPGGGDLDDEVYIPLTTAQLKFFGSAYLSNITLKAAKTEWVDDVEAGVTRLLSERHNQSDFRVRNTASLVEAVSETQDTLTWLLGAVAAISLIVGGIGVMNIMLVNVSERRREIGVRIATGAKPRDILKQFNIEALTVCLLGGVTGVVLGLLASVAMRHFNIAVSFSMMPPLLAFGTSLLVGLIFGYAPARKAASLNPIQALAEE